MQVYSFQNKYVKCKFSFGNVDNWYDTIYQIVSLFSGAFIVCQRKGGPKFQAKIV